jgi:hypothetical protein
METDHLKWLFGYLRLAIGFKKTSFGRIYRNTSFTNFSVMNGPTEELTFAIGKSKTCFYSSLFAVETNSAYSL